MTEKFPEKKITNKRGSCSDLAGVIAERAQQVRGDFYLEFPLKDKTRYFCEMYGIENMGNRNPNSQSVIKVSQAVALDITRHSGEVLDGISCAKDFLEEGLAAKKEIETYIVKGKKLPHITGASLAELILIAERIKPTVVNGRSGNAIHLDSQSEVVARTKQVYGNISEVLSFWEIDNDFKVAKTPTSIAAFASAVGRSAFFDNANCLGVDPDLFFPERGASTREAKEVCRGCVVREDCLEYALATFQKFGIWGGTSERERRRIRRQRAAALNVAQQQEVDKPVEAPAAAK